MIFRCFSRAASIAVLLLFIWARTVLSVSPAPDHITLTWTRDPQTTQTIAWRTDSSVNAGQVRFYEELDDPVPVARVSFQAAETVSLETTEETWNLHSATLGGLLPGRRYAYQVGGGETWSALRFFRTEPLKIESFKFLLFGDSQSLDYNVWGTTLRQAYRTNPDAVFFTNMGDLVDVGQDPAEWDRWFAATEGVAESLPQMHLTGNHEEYTPERRFSRPGYYTAQFRLPENGPDGLKRQVYSFDYGDVHFVFLDSQEGEQRAFVPDLLERQRQWLAMDLAATRKKWKVAFIHRPLYGNKTDGVNGRLRRAFAPLFKQYNVNLVFTAHDHVYARTFPLRNDEAVAPGQGTVYVATGRSGTKTYENVGAKEWNEFFYNPIGEPNYLTVSVSRAGIRVSAVSLSGELIDELLIDAKEEISDRK